MSCRWSTHIGCRALRGLEGAVVHVSAHDLDGVRDVPGAGCPVGARDRGSGCSRRAGVDQAPS